MTRVLRSGRIFRSISVIRMLWAPGETGFVRQGQYWRDQAAGAFHGGHFRPGSRGPGRARRAPDQRRDRRAAVHLRPHGGEPRFLAAAQAPGATTGARWPPSPATGRCVRPARSGRDAAARCRCAAVAVDPVRRAGGRASGPVRALDEHRLVTAVGPGGVGKTRLALECRR